ncbi:SixA phosphatase family protein [Streptomyces sp. LN590]|uniref:SixA phosphatase family protein n=1 Tax=Streptomyces sp. LN590 TaxID=3112980 RepID=UPI003711ECAA
MTSGDCRRLVVLRHAKSAWPDDVADHERHFAPRGCRDAPAAGRWLREVGCVHDFVVCSTAGRTRQTWELVSVEFDATPPVTHDARPYRASAEESLGVVRGHSGACTAAVARRAQPRRAGPCLPVRDGYALELTRTNFPTSEIAVLCLPGPCSDLKIVVHRGASAPRREAMTGWRRRPDVRRSP